MYSWLYRDDSEALACYIPGSGQSSYYGTVSEGRTMCSNGYIFVYNIHYPCSNSNYYSFKEVVTLGFALQIASDSVNDFVATIEQE